ncbi:hypothetical protein GCM10027299_37200 [Larkinella ripae]
MDPSADAGIGHLDRDRLLQLYGDDTQMLVSAIETFLDEVIPNFLELEQFIALQDWEGVMYLTHQLRPWLGMVGLTTLENRLWDIEKQARDQPDFVTITLSYAVFQTNLAQLTPLLTSEIRQ